VTIGQHLHQPAWPPVKQDGLWARVPLKLRLVAGIMAVVTMALVAISIATSTLLNGYLMDQVDSNLEAIASEQYERVLEQWEESGNDQIRRIDLRPGTEGSVSTTTPYYVVQVRRPDGRLGDQLSIPPNLGPDRPRLPETLEDLQQRLNRPYNVLSIDSSRPWRILVTELPDGWYAVQAQDISESKEIVTRLQQLYLLIGLVVLGVAALFGVAVVWASMQPLVEIERTAAAIAAGDLGRRVPDRHPSTEVGRLARALNVMLAQIEAAFRARAHSEAAARRSEERMRRFIADASHELRSPLTTIRGFAELYRHGAVHDPEEVGKLIRRIEGEAERMGILVEDLLLLARLDQQRPMGRAPVDLLALAADAVSGARAVAPDRSIELVVGAGPPVVLGDELRLRQVIDNLMRNALIHTPAGTPIQVRVRVENGVAVLEVADQGPGLTPEQAERVFERFYRVDKARSRKHGSTGLGLAIVAALAAAHGGDTGVHSRPGEGATFWVRLPLAPDAVAPDTSPADAGSPGPESDRPAGPIDAGPDGTDRKSGDAVDPGTDRPDRHGLQAPGPVRESKPASEAETRSEFGVVSGAKAWHGRSSNQEAGDSSATGTEFHR